MTQNLDPNATSAEQTEVRNQAAAWAYKILNQSNWAILDTETTGLSETAEICQVAVLPNTDPYGWQELVKPVSAVEPGARAVHQIGDEALLEARTFDQILPDLLKICGSKELIIFNADFDLRMLTQSARARGIYLSFPLSREGSQPLFINGRPIHCLMRQYSRWIGEWDDRRQDYRWQRLPGGDHSALGDCKAALKLLFQMADDCPPELRTKINNLDRLPF